MQPPDQDKVALPPARKRKLTVKQRREQHLSKELLRDRDAIAEDSPDPRDEDMCSPTLRGNHDF